MKRCALVRGLAAQQNDETLDGPIVRETWGASSPQVDPDGMLIHMNNPGATTRLTAALEGRYRIESELGEGGMATVYLADDLKHERKVALKVLRPELAAVVGAERFLAEIKTTANLTHPSILPLHDSGEADGFLFYVMPYVEGESLRDRLDREHQLPVDDAVRIASDVAEALDYAHGHGVIHRDIKPANILIQAGRPLIADFGIALAVSTGGGHRLTETGLSLGTPHYMSPEQATGDQSVGSATDIYALGCVLYELLVGEPPFTGSTPQAILGKIITGAPESVTAARKSVPSNVEAAIHRALEKVPADRFAGASEFSAALSDPSYGPAAKEGRGRGGASARSSLAVAATVLASTVAGAAVAWTVKPDVSPREVTRFSVEIPGGNMMSLGQYPNMSISPDGRTVVFRAEGQLFMRGAQSFESRPIEGTQGAVGPFFSPDGQWIAFRRRGRFHRVPVSGGPSATFADGAIASGQGATWGEDGFLLYAGANTAKGIRRVPIGGGAPQIITVVDSVESTHAWPQSLDGGRLVLFTVLGPSGRGDDAKIVLQDVESGERVTVMDGASFGRYVPTGHLLYAKGDGTVLATAFDLRSRRVTGDPYPVASGVRLGYWAGGASYTVSETGTIAFVRGSNWENYQFLWVSRDGMRREELGAPITTEEFDLSPDDERVLVGKFEASGNDVFLLDAVTGEANRLTFDGGHWGGVWSPDGSRVAYNAMEASRATAYVQEIDPLSSPVPVYSSTALDYVLSWSPDGRWLLVHESSSQTSGDVLAVGVTNDSVIEVAVTSDNENYGQFSPDGRWITYAAGGQIYVVGFPEIDRKVQVSTGGSTPRWSSAGDELFFWRGETMMAAAVSTTSVFAWETPRPLFEAPGRSNRGFDVSSDGQRFLIRVENPEAPARDIFVVTNFFEELRERTGGR